MPKVTHVHVSLTDQEVETLFRAVRHYRADVRKAQKKYELLQLHEANGGVIGGDKDVFKKELERLKRIDEACWHTKGTE